MKLEKGKTAKGTDSKGNEVKGKIYALNLNKGFVWVETNKGVKHRITLSAKEIKAALKEEGNGKGKKDEKGKGKKDKKDSKGKKDEKGKGKKDKKDSKGKKDEKDKKGKKESKEKKDKKGKKGGGGFGEVSFKGCNETLEDVFGTKKIPPGQMVKKIWDYIRANNLKGKGETKKKDKKKNKKK